MARRKGKLFKQISNVHVEEVQDQDWSSFLKIEKQDPSMRSAYVDKVRISWVLNTDESDDPNQGLLFVASHDSALDSTTPANNDGQIIAATANRGSAGVATLDIKKRVTVNYDNSLTDTTNELLEDITGTPIYLHTYKTNTNSTRYYYLIIKT